MQQTIEIDKLADATFGGQVAALRSLFGLTQKELGIVLGGVSERTVSRWEQDGNEPHQQNRIAVEVLRTVAEALSALFEPAIIKVWIDEPNSALAGERPRDFAKKPGGIYRMAQLLGANGS